MEWIEFREWATFVLSAIVVPLFLMLRGAKDSMNTKLDKIWDKIYDTNNRVGRMETWQEQHQAQDERAFDTNQNEHQELREEVRKVRRQ